MIKVRRNVFETNSSSTHSICISKEKFTDLEDLYIFDKKLNIKSDLTVNFYLDEFGWSEKTYTSLTDKAAYLYTAICELSSCKKKSTKNYYLDFIIKVLDKYGVKYSFEDPETAGSYYIDHAGGLEDFVKSVCHSEKRLMRYLFSDKSFIKTGNDNDDSDVSISVDYKHEEYYKGN